MGELPATCTPRARYGLRGWVGWDGVESGEDRRGGDGWGEVELSGEGRRWSVRGGEGGDWIKGVGRCVEVRNGVETKC